MGKPVHLIHADFLNEKTILLRNSYLTFLDLVLLEKLWLSLRRGRKKGGNILGIFRTQMMI